GRDRLTADEAARATQAPRRQRILLCFNESDTTTAAYCESALRAEHDVVTAGRGQDIDMGEGASAGELVEAGGGAFDLLLCVEGENYIPRDLENAPCPTAWWAIDNHLHASHEEGWHFKLAKAFDHVFIAQLDYRDAFRAHGV